MNVGPLGGVLVVLVEQMHARHVDTAPYGDWDTVDWIYKYEWSTAGIAVLANNPAMTARSGQIQLFR